MGCFLGVQRLMALPARVAALEECAEWFELEDCRLADTDTALVALTANVQRLEARVLVLERLAKREIEEDTFWVSERLNQLEELVEHTGDRLTAVDNTVHRGLSGLSDRLDDALDEISTVANEVSSMATLVEWARVEMPEQA